MLPSSVRVLVCTTPLDLRKSFDGLALAARELLGENPQSGAIFCFANRRMNRLKLLWFDRSGYCLLYKRMHGTRVALPIGAESTRPCVALDGRGLHGLLAGVPKSEKRRNSTRK